MKKTFIRILSIVLCLSLISGSAVLSSATVPATNTDAVATGSDAVKPVITGTTPTRISVVINGDPATSRGITWYTNEKTESDIEIEAEGGIPVIRTAYEEVFEWEGKYVHKVHVSLLNPGTEYKFRVGDGTTYSDWGKFVTDDKAGDVNFIAIADIQASNIDNFKAGAKTINAAFKTMPDAEFMVNLGDFTNDSTNEEWDFYDEAMKDINLNTTLVPVAGNHDGLGVWNWFDNMFNLDTSESVQTKNGVNYSFDYGNAHFAVLNTNDLLSITFAQLQWLKNDMNGTDKDWKIVCMHKTPYTLGKDGKWPDALYLQRSLSAVLDSCDVDLVMSGHDHQYLRTKPLKGNRVDEDGTVYVLAGTAGTKRYGVRTFLADHMLRTSFIDALVIQNGDCNYWDGEDWDQTRPTNKGGIFNCININGGKLTFNSYVLADEADANGNEVITNTDTFVLEKETGKNQITFTGDNSTTEAMYYLGVVPSFCGLAVYTFVEWLPKFLIMLPQLFIDVVINDGSF